MDKIYTRQDKEVEMFYSDTLSILSIAEKLNEICRPTLLGKRFYTDAQLAEKLNISRRTLQDYRDNRLISYYRLNGKILYEEGDVEEFRVSGFFRWAGESIKSIVLSLHNETRSTAQSHPTRSPDRQLRY